MFMLCDKSETQTDIRYQFRETISIFGCNSGYIPQLLQGIIPSGQSEAFPWTIQIAEALAGGGKPGTTILIDLKPGLRENQLSLCELMNVWGYSDTGWTPIMFRLIPLFMDEKLGTRDVNDFVLPRRERDSVFSMTYMSGSVENGKLSGKWTAPAPGATNSVLLWPKVFKYFADQVAPFLAGRSRAGDSRELSFG